MSGSHHTTTPTSELPVIDEGMRRWYDSCSCCLSDAYPEVKAALDAERAAGNEAVAGAGICEVAEGAAAGGGVDASLRSIRPDEDPVCGMTVDVEHARESGLTASFGGREFAFCGKGCFLEFRDAPEAFLGTRHLPTM